MAFRPAGITGGDREVAVEMIGPRRPNPRLAPGEEAGAVAAVSGAWRLTILLEGCSGHRGPLSQEVGVPCARAAIVVRYPRRWVRLELELRILGVGSSPGRSGSARRRPATGDRRARRDD